MNRTMLHTFRAALLAGSALVALFVGRALLERFSKPPVDDIRILADGDRPECPHDWDDYFRPERVRKVKVSEGTPIVTSVLRPSRQFAAAATVLARTYLISGDITNIPEFHDCQRLIAGNAAGFRGFVELAAVFAREKTDSVVAVPGPFVVAEVFSEGSYPSLGIQPGRSSERVRGLKE